MAKQAGLDQAQRDRCWEHYIRGWRPGEIARELNISELAVRNALKAAQDAAKARRAELAADYLQRELDHLDALERKLDETEGELTTARVRVMLDIKARRAKYLGLDKPTEVKHSLSLEDLVAGEAGD